MASNSIAEGVVVPRGVLEVEDIHQQFGPRDDTNANHDINILVDQNLNEVIAARGDTSKPITTIPVGKRPTEIGWDRNRRFCFVVVTGEDNIAVIDIKTLKVIKKIKTFKEPEKFMLLRHTNMALLCSHQESSLALFNLSSKKIVKTLKLPGQFSCLSLWPNPQFDEEEPPANGPHENPGPPGPDRQPPAPGMRPPGPPRDMSHPQPRNFTSEDETSVPPAQGIPQSPAPGSPESPAPGTPQPPAEAQPPSGETPSPGIPSAPAPGTPKEPEHSAPANDVPKPGIPKEPAPGNPEEPISGATASPAASAAPPANAAGNNMQH